MDYKSQFIVARKSERVFRSAFEASESRFYNYLIRLLFRNVLHRHERNTIAFSQRGSSTRSHLLEEAIRSAVSDFEKSWDTQVNTRIDICSQTMIGEPVLQVVDDMNWAVCRAFTRGEMRYYREVESKVSLLVDWYDNDRYPLDWYSRDNPFDIEKANPL